MQDKKRVEYCEACGAKDQEKTLAKCVGCDYNKPPGLWEVNQDAWMIWQAIKTQWRAGGMGVVGLDYSEVRYAAKEFGIEYSTRTRQKIMALEREILNS